MELYHTTPHWSSRASLPVTHRYGNVSTYLVASMSQCSAAVLLYRKSRICVGSLVTYVCVGGGITSLGFSVDWTSSSFSRVNLSGLSWHLVISGKQPSSGLLHTLRFISVCVWPSSAVCCNIASSSSHRGSTLVFPGTSSHVSPHRLMSTTQPLCHCARVYHNIHNRLLTLERSE